MNWARDIEMDRSRLVRGASADVIAQLENRLDCQFPVEYREFLSFADGGYLGNFVFFSAGEGIHPGETLLATNSRDSAYPIIAVGRDASDDFGFLKSDLPAETCPVYFACHETYKTDKVANSFREFVIKVASLKPGEGLAGERKQEQTKKEKNRGEQQASP
jgi:hypothetical protein